MQTKFGGSENTGRVAPLQTEGWLSDTGQVAQSAPDYSGDHDVRRDIRACSG